MKISDILKARNAIASIYSDKLSSKLAYKFTKFLKGTETEENFYREKMQDILKKYGEVDEYGNLTEANNGVKIRSDKRNECFSAIADLESTEVDKPEIFFTIEELDEVKLSTEAMVGIFDFVKE